MSNNQAVLVMISLTIAVVVSGYSAVTVAYSENPFGLRYPYQIGSISLPVDDGLHGDNSGIGSGTIESWTLAGWLMNERNQRFDIFLEYTALNFPWFDPNSGLFEADLPDMVTVAVTDHQTGNRIYQYDGPAIKSFEAWETMLWLEWGGNYLHAGPAPFTYNVYFATDDETVSFDLALTARKYPLPLGWTGKVYLRDDLLVNEYVYTDLVTIGDLSMNSIESFVTGNLMLSHRWHTVELEDILDWVTNFNYYDRFEITLEDGTALVLWIVYPPSGTPYIPAVNLLEPDGAISYYHERMCEPGDRPEVLPIGSVRGKFSENYYRHGWSLNLPVNGLQLNCYPMITHQELMASMWLTDISLWQGSIEVQGEYHGVPISGRGSVRVYAHLPDALSPTPPDNVILTPGNRSVSIEWNPSLDASVAGYKVYWGPESRAYANVVDTKNLTRFSLTNIPNGVRLYLSITAYSAAGEESSYSQEVSAVPTDGTPILSLSLNTDCLYAGEPFTVLAVIDNAGPGHSASLYAALEVAGQFYFLPDFSFTATAQAMYVRQGETEYLTLLSLRMPYDLNQGASFTVHAALTYPDSTELLGYPDSVSVQIIP